MTTNSRSQIFRLKPRLLSLAIGLTLFANVPSYADSNYGPIVQGETLSKIVSENYLVSQYPDSVIMQEIFRLNPESFIANDMGLLKQGVELVLPDDNSIRRSLAVNGISSVANIGMGSSGNRAQLATLQDDLRSVRLERDRLKSSLSSAQSELSSVKMRLSSAQTRLSEVPVANNTAIATDSSKSNATIAALEDSLNTVRSEREDAKSKLAALESEVSDLNTKLETALASESTLTTQLKAANDELASSKKSLADTMQSLSAAKQDAGNKAVEIIGAELTKQNLEKSNALIVEKDKKIAELEVSISDLEKQLVEKTSSEVVNEVVSSGESPEALQEAEKTIADLQQQITVFQDEVKELQTQNDELVNDLMTAGDSGADNLDSAIMEVDPLLEEGLTAASNEISAGGSSFLNKPFTLPTWSALLAALLLGLTTLWGLLGLRKKPVAATVDSSNDVVFKSGSLNAQDEDVEALRVPPRRDPSRVAILDPSMTGELVKTAPSAKNVAVSVEEESSSNDSDLKLAMAEAYMELTDTQAANELLHEVLLEGDSQQKSSAELLMSRLAG